MEPREGGWEGMDCMYVLQDRDQWWVLVNTVMKLQVRGGGGNFLTS